MLRRSGRIELTQDVVRRPPPRVEAAWHLRDVAAMHARVVVDGAITVHYDMHDAQDIDPQDLDRCDVYIKRSFSSAYVGALSRGAEKVLPYGLNYHVLPDFADRFAAGRGLRLSGPRGRTYALREALDGGNRLGFYPRVRELESRPDVSSAPRVLFLVTAYDPERRSGQRSPEKSEERERNNEMRAQCIRRLRRELGSRFVGGFIHNDYTRRRYKDCLAIDAGMTRKRDYVETMKSHPICVATTGLHGSIGWKFAEYIACARAVVSERPMYEVPGGLAAGRNYLEFATPDQCVANSVRLLDAPSLCREMMTANALYYRTSMRPDVLVLNTLLSALQRASRPPPR